MPVSKSEQSFLRTSILATPPHRRDGRGLDNFRPIAVKSGGDIAPLANGSGRVNLGGTEVVAAVKLEIENIGSTGRSPAEEGEGKDGGRVACAIICSQSAYPHKPPQLLDETSADLTALISPVLTSALTPSSQLTVVPQRHSWLLSIEAIILADDGNSIDAVMIAIRAALWDLRIPRTKEVQFISRVTNSGTGVESSDALKDLLKERKRVDPVDFELEDSYDDGEPLHGSDWLPVCVTLNLVESTYFLDASGSEDESVSEKLSLFFSFLPSSPSDGVSHGMHYTGSSELKFRDIGTLVRAGEKHASELSAALNSLFKTENVKYAGSLGR